MQSHDQREAASGDLGRCRNKLRSAQPARPTRHQAHRRRILHHEILDGMNFQRWIAGVPGLTNSPKLSWLATVWAAAMATKNGFTHQEPLGPPLQRPRVRELLHAGENILVGPGT
jgi:uncharacterized protein YkwD